MKNSLVFHKNWFLAARPKTLSAGFVPIVVATALVYGLGLKVDLFISLCALFAAIFIQIATNFFNDAIDYKKGADTSDRLGPKRMTQSGLLSSRQVMISAVVCLLLATLFGIPLVMKGGLVIVAIGLVSLFLAYLYTGGPTPLAYLGLGDLFVILFFGLIAVGGVFYLQTGNYTWSAVVAGLQVGFLSTVLLAINNLRDIEQDRKASKKTIAVRYGKNIARFEILFLFLASFLLGIYWIQTGKWFAAILPLVCLPTAVKITKSVFKMEPSEKYNQLLAQAAFTQLLFSLQLSLGMVIL